MKSLLSFKNKQKSHYRSGCCFSGTWAEHQALSDVFTIDFAQRRAQSFDAGTVLSRPVRQEGTDRMLFLLEGRDPLLLVSEKSRQAAPVAVVHVVAVFSVHSPKQQLLHFLSGVEGKKQTRLFIDVDDCKRKKTNTIMHFYLSLSTQITA